MDSKHGCTRCPLHQHRTTQVVGRGVIPADILFICEAPGKSEDLLGKALLGRQGKLLDRAIVQAGEFAGVIPTYYITNMIQCRPCDSKVSLTRTPSIDEIWACRDNLETVLARVHPRAVVFLGKISREHLRSTFPSAVALQHPAFIVKRGGTESPEFRRFVKDLEEVFVSCGK